MTWRSCPWSNSCIKMSCHHECALHLLFWYLYCFLSGVVCVSVDRGVEVQSNSSTNSCCCQFNKASVNPLLWAYLLTYVFPKYFLHYNIAFDSNVNLLEDPTSCIIFQNHYLFPSYYHSVVVLAWLLICYIAA